MTCTCTTKEAKSVPPEQLMILETDAGTMSSTRKLIILVSKINVPIQAIFKSETTYYIIWTRRLEQG